MAELSQLETALINADKAGDADAARILAGEIKRMRSEAKPADPRNSVMGKIDTVLRGAADTMTFGLADEMSAGADALFNPIFGTGEGGGSIGERYGKNVAAQRATDKADAENRGGYRVGGQLAGGVTGGVGLAKSGLSMGANAAQAGHGLGRVAVGSAADGAIMGGLHGAGSGEGLEGRAKGALGGGGLGLMGGAVAPYAIAGASQVLSPLASPLMAWMRPQQFANNAMGQALQRSGQSPADVGAALTAARGDGQSVFNVADALGNSGQRMLSTAARNPHDGRQALVDGLMGRQAGQGRRVSSAIADAFEAPDTAAQRVASLTAARGQAADAGYGAARNSAGAVDISAAIKAADDVLTPGAMAQMNPGSQLADDSIEAVIRRARSLLTNGRENLTDFNAVLRAKQDIDDMVGVAVRQGKNNQARLLGSIRSELDKSLEGASQPYGAARDAFRQGSREIEAVDAGRNAAQRGRSEDTIPAFQGMRPGEQQAFRAGYADPLIAGAQGGATGVNKARPLINDATAAEFPAFAAPGRGDQLTRRLGREQTMFETNQAAMGGSRTADNLADAADMSKFDPGIMTNLMQGRPVRALVEALSKGLNQAQGMQKPVIERIARMLMETDPQAAMAALQAAAAKTSNSQSQRALANSILNSVGASGAGRLAAP